MSLRSITLPVLVVCATVAVGVGTAGTASAHDATTAAKPAGVPKPFRAKTSDHTPNVSLRAPRGAKSGQAVVAGGSGPAGAAAVDVAAYDKGSGRIQLSGGGSTVRPGQVIDSPPTPAAPHGVLAMVTGVQPTPGGATVATRPATLPELLGHTTAAVTAPVDPAAVQIQSQIKDLQVSYTPTGITSANGSVTGGLVLAANTEVPLPNGSSAALSGTLDLDPSISFSYSGGFGALDPQNAHIGFDLGAHGDWHVAASLTATGTPLRIPIATLTASPVIWVGVLPVVVNVDLGLYADISADGTVTVDAEQSYAGDWGVHSDYTKGQGWTTADDPGTSTVTPVRADVSGSGSVTTGLLVQGSIALYDDLGIKASIEPYLRTAVTGSLRLDPSTPTPVVTGTVRLYGGLDIEGALMARLDIFGTTLAEQDVPFLAYRREWPLASYSSAPSAS